MNFAYTSGGSTPVMKRHRIGITFATAGVPAIIASDALAGVLLATSAAVTDGLGVTLDTGTYSTTQGDAEGLVTMVINPDAVWRILMSGAAAAGTELLLTTNSAVDTGGTVVTITTGEVAPNSPTMDSGSAVCITGANVGQSRKITSVSATAATVTVPFLNDIAASDLFLLLPYSPFDTTSDNIEFTGNLTGASANIAVGTGAAMEIHGLEIDYHGTPRTRSFVLASFNDHVLNAGS